MRWISRVCDQFKQSEEDIEVGLIQIARIQLSSLTANRKYKK